VAASGVDIPSDEEAGDSRVGMAEGSGERRGEGAGEGEEEGRGEGRVDNGGMLIVGGEVAEDADDNGGESKGKLLAIVGKGGVGGGVGVGEGVGVDSAILDFEGAGGIGFVGVGGVFFVPAAGLLCWPNNAGVILTLLLLFPALAVVLVFVTLGEFVYGISSG
jgi:hypothetical protein